jgi:hypothetical protein
VPGFLIINGGRRYGVQGMRVTFVCYQHSAAGGSGEDNQETGVLKLPQGLHEHREIAVTKVHIWLAKAARRCYRVVKNREVGAWIGKMSGVW